MVSRSFAMASPSPGILDSRERSAAVQGPAMAYKRRLDDRGDLRRASGRADHRALPVPALPMRKTARTLPANGAACAVSMVQVELRRALHPRRSPGPAKGCEGASGESLEPSLPRVSCWRSWPGQELGMVSPELPG